MKKSKYFILALCALAFSASAQIVNPSGTVKTCSNEGAGVAVCDTTNSTPKNLAFKTLVQGSNITLTDGGAAGITIAASGSAVNLTGPITSVGAATSIASQTGTGTKFVVDNSPTIITPTFSGTAIGNISGNSATVTTNANLTGPITSVGNATSIASQTGTGTKFVVDTSPTLTGTPLAPTASIGTGTTQIATTAYVDNQTRLPSFSAYAGTGTTTTSSTFSKINFDTEIWDANSNFASSRWTPIISGGGYAQVNSCVTLDTGGINNTQTIVSIFVNGSEYKRGPDSISTNTATKCVSGLVKINGSTDYIEIFYYIPGATKTTSTGSTLTWFDGVVIRGQ